MPGCQPPCPQIGDGTATTHAALCILLQLAQFLVCHTCSPLYSWDAPNSSPPAWVPPMLFPAALNFSASIAHSEVGTKALPRSEGNINVLQPSYEPAVLGSSEGCLPHWHQHINKQTKKQTKKERKQTFFQHPGGHCLTLGTDSVSILCCHSEFVTGPWPQILHYQTVGIPRGCHFTSLSVSLVSSVCISIAHHDTKKIFCTLCTHN